MHNIGGQQTKGINEDGDLFFCPDDRHKIKENDDDIEKTANSKLNHIIPLF